MRHALFVLIAATLLFGIGDELIDEDQAWYAEVATQMYTDHTPWRIMHDGRDWLDKPHMQFWPMDASFELFGHGPMQAQLPGLFFALLALGYVWRLGGVDAALVLGTSLHFVYSANDLRAEVSIAAFCAMAFYHAKRYLEDDGRTRDLLLAALAAASAFMTKGMIAVLPLITAFLGNALVNRRAPQLGRAMLLVLFAALGCAPAIVAYWFQFDAHPEKSFPMFDWGEVRGLSGVRFFLWDSQVGRFFNSGAIKGNGHPGFFLHTLLWAMLPWALYWYLALVREGRLLVRAWRQREPIDATLFFAVLPTFSLLNISRFQLPHYVVLLFPFMTVQVARVLDQPIDARLHRLHAVLAWLLLLAALALAVALPRGRIIDIGVCVVVLALAWRLRDHLLQHGHLLLPALGSATLLFVLNASLVPTLIASQCSTQLARAIAAERIDPAHIRTLGWHSHDLAFSLARVIPTRSVESLGEELQSISPLYVVTPAPLVLEGLQSEVLARFEGISLTTFARDVFKTGAAREASCQLLRVQALRLAK